LILFLDEIHTLVGAGASAGESLEASSMLKPALARGELRCIGATTVEEYRRYIERDAALERRFEKILVEEPTSEQALAIVSGLCPLLEAHHGVEIDPEAMQAAVDFTVRYVPERRLPDKALDALDQSCARRRLEIYATSLREASPEKVRPKVLPERPWRSGRARPSRGYPGSPREASSISKSNCSRASSGRTMP